METNKILMALMAVFAISLVSFGVIAYKGDPNINGPNYNEDVHEQLEDALEAGDYNLWLSIREENNLPTRGKIFSVINEDNFDLFQQLHEANEAGDVEAASLIRTELGLGLGMMKRGNSNGKGTQGSNFNNGNCDNYDQGYGRNR